MPYSTSSIDVTLNSAGITGFIEIWKSLEMAPFDRSHTSSYSFFIVNMAVSCTVFEIKRDIGRKTPIFHTPFVYLARSSRTPSNFAQNFNTNCPSP